MTRAIPVSHEKYVEEIIRDMGVRKGTWYGNEETICA